MIKKLQMEKIDIAAKYHDIVGMLDTHLIQGEVDVMIKENKLGLSWAKLSLSWGFGRMIYASETIFGVGVGWLGD